jgi:hypothetical protein
MQAIAKGATFRSTIDFVTREHGEATATSILERLASGERDAIARAAAAAELPFELLASLWRAADAVLAGADPAWMERAGAFSIESSGIQHYGGILRKASPLEFLTQRVSLFRLYYHPGDMAVVYHEPGTAVLRLVDCEIVDPLFCRRQTGGLRRALELAGGTGIGVAHVRCRCEGDAFCEWSLKWS